MGSSSSSLLEILKKTLTTKDIERFQIKKRHSWISKSNDLEQNESESSNESNHDLNKNINDKNEQEVKQESS